MPTIKEFDGGRSMEIEADPNFVYVEMRGMVLSLDRSLFLHAMKRALGIALIVEEVSVGTTV